MRIITLNVNGVRSAARKGLFRWLARQKADVVCLQETKAQLAQLNGAEFFPNNYTCEYLDAEKKGYSGVAIFSRLQPRNIIRGLGDALIDSEARYLEFQFPQLSVVSLYAPSGSSGQLRQEFKFRFMDIFMPYLSALRKKRRQYILCGDWNIAHRAIDLKNWRGNQKNSGFLPEERAWMEELFGRVGFVDAFRAVDPRPEQYTWWSNRGQAWKKNVGWRIDYQVVTPGLADKIQAARIYKQQRFSDHAPLIVDYSWSLSP